MVSSCGYAGKVLRADLSSPRLNDIPVHDYSHRFLGGRGLGAKVYWDEVAPHAGALDPENRLVIVTGPLGGFRGLASSLYQFHGKSPYTIPEQYCSSNSAGFWGARLKFAGYDALIVHGQSERPVYLLIRNGVAELRDASHLWGRGAVETRELLKAELGSSAHVLAIGPGGENLVSFANVLGEGDASAGQGFGAVMGSKRLKAIVAQGGRRPTAARPEELQQLREHIRRLDQGRMPLPMSAYATLKGVRERKYPCFGCMSHCYRTLAETADGVKSKRLCHSGNFYQAAAQEYYGEYNEVVVLANRLCNDYGLDTMGLDRMIKWMSRCHAEGTLTGEDTDIPLSKKGSLEYIEAVVRKVALREGFGDILAGGPAKAAAYVGGTLEDFAIGYTPGHESRGGPLIMDPRTYIYTGIIHAMEPRDPTGQLGEIALLVSHWVGWLHKMAAPEAYRPGAPSPLTPARPVQDPSEVKEAIDRCYVSSKVIREVARRFWGGELAVDFSTYDGKALAAKKVVDRSYAKECLVACNFKWPIISVPHSQDHVGDPRLESRVLSAVTGREMDEEEYYQVGERVFNLTRAIRVREGHGGRERDKLPDFCFTSPIYSNSYNPDCLAPGRNGMLVSLRGASLDRRRFSQVMDEYYQLRGWDVATGLQRRGKLVELGLGDIVPELEKGGCLSGAS